MVRLVVAGSILLVLLAATTTRCEAWVASQGIGSKFAGAVLQERVPSSTSSSSSCNQKCVLEMKKKGKVPMPMRSEYKKQQQAKTMQAQMQDAQNVGEDGFPIFNLFVRSRLANIWYPCGSFKGDERSQALCTSYRDNGILAGIAKKQIDQGVAGSLARDFAKLEEQIVRGYPQLKESRKDGGLEWGYRLSFNGLTKDQKKTTIVEPKVEKGFFDNVKGLFSQ